MPFPTHLFSGILYIVSSVDSIWWNGMVYLT